jgi:hypothetical protein
VLAFEKEQTAQRAAPEVSPEYYNQGSAGPEDAGKREVDKRGMVWVSIVRIAISFVADSL